MTNPAPARLALIGAALLVCCAAATPGTAPDLASRIAADSARAGAQVLAGHADSALARTTALVAFARAQGDRGALARTLRMQGAVLANTGAGAAALTPLREAERLTVALGDTATLVRVLRWQAFALGEQGRFAEQASVAQRQWQLARRIGDRTNEAHALHSLGWVALRGARYPAARETLAMAVALHHALGAANDEANARATYGSALLGLGAYDEARANYNEVLSLAHRLGRTGIEARAWNDLGVLENRIGDPAAAERAFRAAFERHREMSQWQEALLELSNALGSALTLGRVNDAMRDAHAGLAIADAKGLRYVRGPFLMELAEAEAALGHPREARRRIAEALALGDTLPRETRVSARIADARLLARLGGIGEARARLADTARDAATLAPETQLELATATAELALAANDPAAARANATRALATVGADRGLAGLVKAAVLLGRSALVSGDLGGADSAFTRAIELWERTRVRASDPEWRESQGRDLSADLALGIALVRLAPAPAPDRIAAAFDAMEPLRTRTLLERMAGPLRDSALATPRLAPIRLAKLQHDVLRAGELALVTQTSPETTLVFAITRDTALVYGVTRDAAESAAIADLGDLLTASQRAPVLAPACERALAAQAEAWLAPIGALLPRVHRVIVAPDGALHALPWEALFVAHGSVATEVTRVPSASVLAALRSAPAAPANTRVLAFAGPALDGVALPGARREVRALAERFANVDVRDVPEIASAAPAFAPQQYALLHFAAHTEIDEQHPWRSALVLGRAAAGDSSGRWSAAAIARERLPARLVMLASCRAASGLAARGEGLAGLTSAFLIAGAPAVVASQWPVEDAVAERFEDAYYRALAHGADAAGALTRAREALRSDPRTRAPFHWAGWVLVGDGSARPNLRANVLSFRHLWLALAVLAAAVAVLAGARARRATEDPATRV